MPELEIKEVLTEIVKLLNAVGPIPEEIAIKALSRFEDVLNHMNAHTLASKAEIEALKIRIEKLEGK